MTIHKKLTLAAVFTVLISTHASAGQVNSLNMTTFSSGTPAIAAEVNDNFSELTSQINDNDENISGKQERVTGNCTAGGTIKQINADGSVTCSSGVSFSAVLSADLTTTDFNEVQLIDFAESHDDGNNFDQSTGVYTIPSDGVYQFIVNVEWSATTTLSDVIALIRLKNNAAIFQQSVQRIQLNSSFPSNTTVLGIVKANAGDAITFHALYSSGTQITITGGGGSGKTNVAGFKIY